MSNISVADIQKLRNETGAGMMSAKNALEEANGDYDKAVELLRRKGEATAAKKADRTTSQGLIEAYVHSGKIGVLVELVCETDFVARTEDFKNLAHDIAMHVAASSPAYLSSEEVPEAEIKKEADIYKAEAADSGKPEAVIEKIVEGKLAKYYSEICLLEQPFLKDPEVSVGKHITATIAKLGENIAVRRFVRYELGDNQ